MRILGALVVVAMTQGMVRAQDATDSDDEVYTPEPSEEEPALVGEQAQGEEEARTRFNLGQQLYEQGRFEEALEQFRAAHELSGRPGLLYNIYLCHRDAGNTREAASSLRAYLEAEPSVANRAMLERRLITLDEQIAREDEIGRRPVVAERDFTGPIVMMVSGAVVFAAGGALGLANRSLYDDISGRCYDGEVCLSEEAGDIDALDRRNLTADLLVAIGGGVILGGLIWLVVEGTRSASSTGEDVAVACGVTGCSVRGRF